MGVEGGTVAVALAASANTWEYISRLRLWTLNRTRSEDWRVMSEVGWLANFESSQVCPKRADKGKRGRSQDLDTLVQTWLESLSVDIVGRDKQALVSVRGLQDI